MTAPRLTPHPFVVPSDDLRADAVLDGGAVASAEVALVDVAGPGAVACLQGLLTNDLEQPGDGAFVYAALLTPKGMILSDLWATRSGGGITLTLPRAGLAPLLNVFQRSLPPRLAHAVDHTEHLDLLRVLGPRGLEIAAAAGVAIPPAGRAITAVVGGVACVVARPEVLAPFVLQIQVARESGAAIRERLVKAGAAPAGSAELELSRILSGWPKLGAEIDQKTLPQEVRYDELGGVSYTKGCYTGQETVARLHFRGHPNRHLVGLQWESTPDLSVAAVVQEDRDVGRVTSAVWLAPMAQHVGLAIVRREVAAREAVTAAGATAHIVNVPFELT